MVSHVYMICHAYEAGVGKGRDGYDGPNPYDASPGINAECHEAWGIGLAEGRDQIASERANTQTPIRVSGEPPEQPYSLDDE